MERPVALLTFTFFICLASGIFEDDCNEELLGQVHSWNGAEEEFLSDLIHISFASVRDGLPDMAPQLRGNSTCAGPVIRLMCLDSDYLGDIYCDFGQLKNHLAWEEKSRVYEISMAYEHPTMPGVVCEIHFVVVHREEFQLGFNGGRCEPAVEDQTIPRFRVAKVTRISISFFPGEHFSPFGSCIRNTFLFSRGEDSEVSMGTDNSPREAVAFVLDRFCCVNVASEVSFGRKEKNINSFSYDGRRYRPL